jgi:hypothetical protein
MAIPFSKRVGTGLPSKRHLKPTGKLTPFNVDKPVRPGVAPGTGRPGRPNRPAPPNKPKPEAKPPEGRHPEFDEPYQRTIGNIDADEATRLSNIADARSSTVSEFGIDDPTNPSSRAAALKRAYLARRKAASAGLASRGQLYSGSHERALLRTRQEEDRAYGELRSAYMAAMAGLSEQERNVTFQSEAEREQAFQDWLARAPEADVGNDPTAGDAGDTPAAAPVAAPVRAPDERVSIQPPQNDISHVPATVGPPGLQKKILKLRGKAPKGADKPHNKGKGKGKTRPKVKPMPKTKIKAKG